MYNCLLVGFMWVRTSWLVLCGFVRLGYDFCQIGHRVMSRNVSLFHLIRM